MNCKYCNAELPEDSTVCQSCGKDNMDNPEQPEESKAAAAACGEGNAPETAENPEPEITNEKKKLTGIKLTVIIVAAAALITVLALAIIMGTRNGNPDNQNPTIVYTKPTDGNPDNETCKGSYTVSDEQAIASAQTVIATMGNKKLTNGQLQVYYWMQVYSFLDFAGQYAPSYGLEYTQPLDMQLCSEGTTWQQQFLKSALDSWRRYEVMKDLADEAGLKLSTENQKMLDDLKQNLEADFENNGFKNISDMITANFGAGVSFESYQQYVEAYLKGYRYYEDACSKLAPTDEEIRAFFDAHKKEYKENGLTEDMKIADVRHILLQPENGKANEIGIMTFSDEDWEACRKKAQDLLDQWAADGAKEEQFAKLAQEHSADPGSKSNGGLYQGITKDTNFVQEFKDWCLDDSRSAGDYGLVKTMHGYHIMYLSNTQSAWMKYAEEDLISEQSKEIVDKIARDNPMEVDYSSIVLADVSLKAKS